MSRTMPTPFGIMLRQYRMSTGLTQEELAERAQVSTRAVSDLEREGSRIPRVYTVRQLSEALRLAGDDLATFLAAARVTGVSAAETDLVSPGITSAVLPLPV